LHYGGSKVSDCHTHIPTSSLNSFTNRVVEIVALGIVAVDIAILVNAGAVPVVVTYPGVNV
jgi:hypothetical protein